MVTEFGVTDAAREGVGEGAVFGATSKSPHPSSSWVSSLCIGWMLIKELVTIDAGRVLGTGEGWDRFEAEEGRLHCWLGLAIAGFSGDPRESGVDVDWTERGFDWVCCAGGCEKSSKAAKRSADMFEGHTKAHQALRTKIVDWSISKKPSSPSRDMGGLRNSRRQSVVEK